ncbi:MAG TPA: VOC family protein [Terracidiphilus sp.]|nr:VOC family protein [Terracidiphilus sp.]
MSKMIFINLPVANLAKSRDFYEAIGAKNNPQFTDDTAACMVFSDSIHVMLLTHDKWATFTKKAIPDSHRSSEVMLALSCESRASVDALVDAANVNGGRSDVNPKQDHGFMYSRSCEDPDGHVWEAFWMDMSAFPAKA